MIITTGRLTTSACRHSVHTSFLWCRRLARTSSPRTASLLRQHQAPRKTNKWIFLRKSETKCVAFPTEAHYDTETVYQILDAGCLCHLGFVVDDQPFVIPTLYGREGDKLYLHGSTASRMMKHVAAGVPVCATVTHVDGLVLARSAFHHSMNYRSVVAFGRAVEVDGDAKLHGLLVISESFLKNRWSEVRAPNENELKATSVIEMAIESASAKIRTGPPIDEEEDYALPIWAGVIPVTQQFGQPANDPRLQPSITPPQSVTELLNDARQ